MTTQILKRKFIDIEPAPGKVGLKGEYQLTVRREDGSIKSQTPWFENIILDSGLNRWGTATIFGGAAVGTGTSTPTAAQTALDSQTTFTTTTGSGSGVVAAQGSAPYYITRTMVYRTALGALNGNYSEVGIGWASGAMFSRALIVDGGGSPTTVSVLSSEQLDIAYRLRVYPPATDITTTKTIGGVSYSITGRAAKAASAAGTRDWYMDTAVPIQTLNSFPNHPYLWTGAIGAITGEPSGTQSGSGPNPALTAYSNNSYTRLCSTTFGLTEGNIGGARCYTLPWSMAAFQYDFGAAIPKDSTKTLVLNTSISWARK